MARIRTIKPEFWEHEQLGRCSLLARLTFAGFISLADDEGRGRADTEFLWGRLHSGQHPNVKRTFPGALSELKRLRDDEGPLVVFYRVSGAAYYWLPGFCRQQRIDRPSKSKLPPPPNSTNPRRALDEGSTLDQGSGKGSRKGGDQGGKAAAAPAAPPADPPPISASPETPDSVPPAPPAAERKDGEELEKTLRAFDFCESPIQQTKAREIRDLLRQGVSHERLRSAAKGNPTSDFYAILKALRNSRAAPPFVSSTPKPVREPCSRCGSTGMVYTKAKNRFDEEHDAATPCPECTKQRLERREVAP